MANELQRCQDKSLSKLLVLIKIRCGNWQYPHGGLATERRPLKTGTAPGLLLPLESSFLTSQTKTSPKMTLQYLCASVRIWMEYLHLFYRL